VRSIIVVIIMIVMPSDKAETVEMVARCAKQAVVLSMPTASLTREIGPAEKLYVILKKTRRVPLDISAAQPLAAAERLAAKFKQ
jgi:hypothetical protein